MGVGRALVFALFAILPGALLSLVGWVLIGSPESWSNGLYLACYAPFFGCVAAGFYLGWRAEGDIGVEA
ncbi:MAG: hypothetical protein QGF28_03350 [Candidatus Thalassarchaeaceae archaeon]|jgi:hypothetical protein|nr:hypothetical protein [Euryarchaeota archaeon]MDP7091352.1 hypothetical protein [Candidatus Thalassarchaeaceae archaeon]MDP7256558.1 hypothetical protein [Candidatus Thalassarchaeaceae archaeon]MDP7446224.1 hypothetical protein [Candidatus Thalassarchaeaceae archaeon]MDP7648687.1 hypothetical protein [Candidatus Thalassarchaeaceae archaeon]|tara:strand:+ start:641 stop:847 length:207 start_codon:yes stop_codon:yes gene_type:complete